MLAHDHESYIAYGRGNRPSQSELIKVGGQLDVLWHGLKTALLDRHGFGSKPATQDLVRAIRKLQPDVIGMHNIHGYYLNIEVLFHFFAEVRIPVVWTLHDCWAFTGHCTHYENIGCEKWKTACYSCPKTNKYPRSFGLDASRKNYFDKKRLFNLPRDLTIITPCEWMKNQVNLSFLKKYSTEVIYNGVDIDVFKPVVGSKLEAKNKSIVLGVASSWQASKGLNDFYQIASILPENKFQIILIGLDKKQLRHLPSNIKGIARTESVQELASWYSKASVFVNPTYLDTFPTTNVEALACGTPVVTYQTGGCPEAVDENTGKIVPVGDVSALWRAIQEVTEGDREQWRQACRDRALRLFDKKDRYQDYLSLYQRLLSAQSTAQNT